MSRFSTTIIRRDEWEAETYADKATFGICSSEGWLTIVLWLEIRDGTQLAKLGDALDGWGTGSLRRLGVESAVEMGDRGGGVAIGAGWTIRRHGGQLRVLRTASVVGALRIFRCASGRLRLGWRASKLALLGGAVGRCGRERLHWRVALGGRGRLVVR